MRSSGIVKKSLFLFLIVLLVALIIGAIFFFTIYFSVKLDQEKVYAERSNVIIYDKHGTEIQNEFLFRYVDYADINSNIINAFVALEDKRFFSHKGVDYYRTVGAFVHNIKNGYAKEGGSTITQQLAKNTHLSNEKTIIRKIKEMKLAREIENNYKKEDILEMYLNAIYYGNGIYGIDAACKKYFAKTSKEILPAEAAILAGIVKNPQNNSPMLHPENAEKRMKLVLRLMYEQGYLSESEYDTALSYRYNKPDVTDNGSYYSAIISEAATKLGTTEQELIRKPIKIYTYCDTELHNKVLSIINDEDYELNISDDTIAERYCLVLDNTTGGVIAYSSVGKTDAFTKRQPGSTIKPLAVYTPAIESRMITEATVFSDEKKEFDGYSPANFNNVYLGDIDVETAVKYSVNTVAVEIFSKLDRTKIFNTLLQCGLSFDNKDDGLALALGGMTYGLNALELSGGYMTLANGGVYQEVGFVSSIVSEDGTVLYRKNNDKNRVFSADSAYIMTDLLEKTARKGTAKKLSDLPFSIAAKTGTVGDNKGNTDSWCLSYSPDYTVCVRYGTSEHDQRIETTGGGMPTLLTRAVFSSAKIRKKYFDEPQNIVYANVDLFAKENTGEILLANDYTPKKYRKTYCFTVDTVPNEESPYFNDASDEVTVEREETEITISFRAKYPFSYRLIREDLTDGSNVEIWYLHPHDYFFFSDKKITDEIIGDHLVRYRLETMIDGYLIGQKYSRPIIISS